jgi:hypothetical protein
LPLHLDDLLTRGTFYNARTLNLGAEDDVFYVPKKVQVLRTGAVFSANGTGSPAFNGAAAAYTSSGSVISMQSAFMSASDWTNITWAAQGVTPGAKQVPAQLAYLRMNVTGSGGSFTTGTLNDDLI